MTCSACKGRCSTPEACQLPQPTPLPRTFEPDYTISGPHRARRRRTAYLTVMAVLAVLIAIRALARFFNLL